MENLNDLIWTDEDDDDSVNTLGVNMRQICMIAFCQSIVGGGKNPPPGAQPVGEGYAC